jgi:hypothetical protein
VILKLVEDHQDINEEDDSLARWCCSWQGYTILSSESITLNQTFFKSIIKLVARDARHAINEL